MDAACPQPTIDRYCVCIGNSKYHRQLLCTENDARLIVPSLKQLTYEVFRCTLHECRGDESLIPTSNFTPCVRPNEDGYYPNLTSNQLRKLFSCVSSCLQQKWKDDLRPHRLLIFFAGHGRVNESGHQVLYGIDGSEFNFQGTTITGMIYPSAQSRRLTVTLVGHRGLLMIRSL